MRVDVVSICTHTEKLIKKSGFLLSALILLEIAEAALFQSGYEIKNAVGLVEKDFFFLDLFVFT